MTDHFDKIAELDGPLENAVAGKTSCFCGKFDPEFVSLADNGRDRLYRCRNCDGDFVLYIERPKIVGYGFTDERGRR